MGLLITGCQLEWSRQRNIVGFRNASSDRKQHKLEMSSSRFFFPVEVYSMAETVWGTYKNLTECWHVGTKRARRSRLHHEFGGGGGGVPVICVLNAAGVSVPLMFVYRRQRVIPTVVEDGRPGALYKYSKNGWTNEGLFISWLQNFSDHVKPNPQKPKLLVPDNDSATLHWNHINSANKTA
jgi:hypothetical protein